MLRNIDHIVVVVRDLARASADYERAGFTVTAGGEHVGGVTHNALISFADGTYFELIAFREPDRPQEHKWWSRLQVGEGLVDYALGADDLSVEAERIRQASLPLQGPVDGGRLRPDGQQIAWRTVLLGRGIAIGTERPALPFVIQDVTRRDLRVPGGPATRHQLGVNRVAGLTLLTGNLDDSARSLGAVLGVEARTPPSRAERGGAARWFPIGRQWLELIQPADQSGPLGRHLAEFGDGPYEVVLSGGDNAQPGDGPLLSGQLHGARLRVAG